ncbi:MAG: YqeG family HAD IIIA-type phosphatase [Oscillospiraceae bacterium]|nr:YqeG family HAD IIIA-type phosphatase [Oscillospiraceae bacterium]
MPFSLLPRQMADRLTDITPELLQKHNIQLLMLDFDNTIVPYTTTTPAEDMEKWLREMNAREDLQICIVSNSHNDRVPKFCRERGLDVITHAKKPFTKGIVECLNKYGIPKANAALVGDQIYTDVLGANSAGICSILVKAIDNHNFWLKARHVLEQPFIFIARNRRIAK